MLERKVLIIKRLEAPDASRATAIAIEKITALAHEVGNLGVFFSSVLAWAFQKHIFIPEERNQTHNTMKFRALVPLRPADRILALSRTELAKVFCRLGDYILE